MTAKTGFESISSAVTAGLSRFCLVVTIVASSTSLRAQAQPGPTPPAPNPSATPPVSALTPGTAPAPSAATPTPAKPTAFSGVVPPSDYVIGADDVLSIVYWRDKDMTGDVRVRPDGKISLPLLNDIQTAGLTPAQLRDRLTEESRRYIEDPNVTVVVREINSRKVFITGEVAKPGPYPLVEPTTVLQLIAIAGGLREYADSKKIVIMRTEMGQSISYAFNYKDVISRRNLRQNIELKPGDTVIVP